MLGTGRGVESGSQIQINTQGRETEYGTGSAPAGQKLSQLADLIRNLLVIS